jgi:hypothetical protein
VIVQSIKIILWVIPPALVVAAVGLVLWFKKDVLERDTRVGGGISQLRVAPAEEYDFGLDKFDAAVALLRDGEAEEARRALLAMLRHHRDSARAPDAMRLLGQLNLDRLFDPAVPWPGKAKVEVKRGDSLNKIAADHRSTFHYLVRANGLARPEAVQPHDQLWVCPMDFEVLLRLADKQLVLMDDGLFFAVFPVLEARRPPGVKASGSGKIGNKFGQLAGKRVQVHEEAFTGAEKWIEIGGNWAIRSVPAGAPPPAGFGVFLAEADAADLVAVLRRGNAVEWVP